MRLLGSKYAKIRLPPGLRLEPHWGPRSPRYTSWIWGRFAAVGELEGRKVKGKGKDRKGEEGRGGKGKKRDGKGEKGMGREGRRGDGRGRGGLVRLCIPGRFYYPQSAPGLLRSSPSSAFEKSLSSSILLTVDLSLNTP